MGGPPLHDSRRINYASAARLFIKGFCCVIFCILIIAVVRSLAAQPSRDGQPGAIDANAKVVVSDDNGLVALYDAAQSRHLGAGALTINGDMAWTGGEVATTGTFTINSLTLSPTCSISTALGSSEISITDKITLAGSLSLSFGLS